MRAGPVLVGLGNSSRVATMKSKPASLGVVGSSYILTALHCIQFLAQGCVRSELVRSFFWISCFDHKIKNSLWECLFQSQ